MPSNFDRATIHLADVHVACPTARMTFREFVAYVARDAPDVRGEFANDALRRSYDSIAPFDVDKPEAYADARASAIDGYRARVARVRSLTGATRSAAPSSRGALVASMPDLRMGADVGYEVTALDG